ncbi:hypothetical protein ACJZ2D_008670 [Fusarium nematophilum]
MAPTTVRPPSYKAAVIEAVDAPLKIIQVDLKRPAPGQVLVRSLLMACAIPMLAFSRVISDHISSAPAVLTSGINVKDCKVDPIKVLKELGGAALIVATAPNSKAVAPLTGALRAAGKLCVLSPVGGVEINSFNLISKAASVHGWMTGHALDCEDAIDFARSHGIECLVERFSLEQAQEAMDTTVQNKVRFRSVLVFGPK